jgi:hypothetical protein
MKRAEEPELLPPMPGYNYLVRGYHTGEFIGRVESVDRQCAHVSVVDPLRPHQRGSCPFPQCIRDEDHDGGHIFPSLCVGAKLEIPWRLAQFEQHQPSKVVEFKRRGAA